MIPDTKPCSDDPLPQVGQKVSGVVTGFENRAARITLDSGHTAFVKEGHLSWDNPVAKDDEIFAKGDRVEGIVLKTKARSNRRTTILLGYRETKPDPRDQLAQRYPINSRHTGKVVNFTKHGAFIELSGGFVSYLLNAEISWARHKVKAPDVLKLGDTIEVVVTEVDMVKKRLTLSHRLTLPNPWGSVQTEYPTGTHVTGCVSSVLPYGVFVTLPNSCSGMVHISALPPKSPPESFTIGNKIGVVILKIEPEYKRITLGFDPTHETSLAHNR